MARKDKDTAKTGNDDTQFQLPLDEGRALFPFRIVRRQKLGGEKLIFPTKEHIYRLKGIDQFESFKDCVQEAIALGVSLQGADLTDMIDLAYINAQDEETQTKIKQASSLENGDYEGADFRNCLAEGVHFSGSNLKKADFSGRMDQEQIEKSGYNGYTTELSRASFSGCNVSGAIFDNAILERANFGQGLDETLSPIDCQASGASFKQVNLAHARFSKTTLSGATISVGRESFIRNAYFDNINFKGVAQFPFYTVDPDRYRNCQFPEGFSAPKPPRRAPLHKPGRF